MYGPQRLLVHYLSTLCCRAILELFTFSQLPENRLTQETVFSLASSFSRFVDYFIYFQQSMLQTLLLAKPTFERNVYISRVEVTGPCLCNRKPRIMLFTL